MKPFVLALAACVGISGCGGMGDVISRYGSIKPVHFAFNGEDWRAFDNPAAGQIMITPTIGRAGAAGAKAGITFQGPRTYVDTADEYKAAAQAYISGRTPACKVTAGRELLLTQHEFDYSC